MSFLVDVFLARYSGITVGFLGLISSLALSKGPLDTLLLRRAMASFDAAKDTLDVKLQGKLERSLKRREIAHLRNEGVWTLVGLTLLGASFVVLIASQVWLQYQPAP